MPEMQGEFAANARKRQGRICHSDQVSAHRVRRGREIDVWGIRRAVATAYVREQLECARSAARKSGRLSSNNPR